MGTVGVAVVLPVVLGGRVCEGQVWSLTKFYSVDFLQSRTDVKGAFSTNAQSGFASVVVDRVLGPSRLRAPCQLKKPFEGPRRRRGKLLGGTEENSVSPMRGH